MLVLLLRQVWELVPAALQDALAPLVGEKQDEVEANPQVRLTTHHERIVRERRNIIMYDCGFCARLSAFALSYC